MFRLLRLPARLGPTIPSVRSSMTGHSVRALSAPWRTATRPMSTENEPKQPTQQAEKVPQKPVNKRGYEVCPPSFFLLVTEQTQPLQVRLLTTIENPMEQIIYDDVQKRAPQGFIFIRTGRPFLARRCRELAADGDRKVYVLQVRHAQAVTSRSASCLSRHHRQLCGTD